MKSKNDKSQKNQYNLLEHFLSMESLSIKQIMDLLSCGRKSAYNYIKRLEEKGYSFQTKTIQNNKYYSIAKDTVSDDLLYQPVTADTLRKYTILHELQNDPTAKNALRSKFTVYKNNEKCTDNNRIPLDIKLTQYYAIIKDLINNEDIMLNDSNKKYYITGKNIPLQISLDYDSLYNLNIELSTAVQGTAYYEQLKNLYRKTCILLGTIDEDAGYYNNYLIYGKKIGGLSSVTPKLQQITQLDYQHKALQINYTTKHGKDMSILFAVGMIVYNTEKDVLYLLGEEFCDKNNENCSLPTIINVSDITRTEETILEHQRYYADSYIKLFDSMFSISLEEPQSVKVEFDRVANVERKINQLKSQRKNASIQVENNKIIYTDTISGLSDFAKYLRKFGKSAHVIEPQALKNKMKQSFEQTLARYEEVSTGELL